MPDQERKSPEDWEAGDIIDELKAGLPLPGVPPPSGQCAFHASSVRAQIWIIRHMDRKESSNLSVSAVMSTLIAGVIIGLVEAAKHFLGASTVGQ